MHKLAFLAETERWVATEFAVGLCPSSGELAEEAPFADKDVERGVDVVHRAGLARKVARLWRRGVVKG